RLGGHMLKVSNKQHLITIFDVTRELLVIWHVSSACPALSIIKRQPLIRRRFSASGRMLNLPASLRGYPLFNLKGPLRPPSSPSLPSTSTSSPSSETTRMLDRLRYLLI